MKRSFAAILFVLPLSLTAQKESSGDAVHNGQPDKGQEQKFEPITLYFVMLKKGPDRTQDSMTARNIQEQHLANINKLASTGKLLVAGPFLDNDNWRGIFILKTDSLDEAEQLVKTDPAIKAGRLSYEIHPWMTGKNCLFK